MRQQIASNAATPRPHACTADEELDLSCTWEPALHGEGREAVRAYVEKEMPHLLRSYDCEFLADAVENTRRHHGR
jgi:hypothetical protein